ncbi:MULTISPECIES: cyclin-dependent kinase inhibitor 3 family protein [unclassified Anaeromyxobacter]|uniref:cyclin-dependent kinase inhibitor 3 family protein n=1 Tax=unclassified Anaeromyxobacter TaxID=2620896 RepID=UPI001F55B8D1|nr:MULTISPECIES: cyclin-dependent kinase inhibitor 3 family protein [unclassified Anaeromyxobacter]
MEPYALRVDYLPASALALPGRLGLTRAPGRWVAGRDPDSDVRLREDVEAIARVHGAKVLVTLLERFEIAELGDLDGEARRERLRWIHYPIADMWAPTDLASARRLVGRILHALERGHDVVVHCWGGVGRAGTIAASCLVARGTPPAEAIAIVRAARGRAIENAAQERFVREFGGDLE